MENTSNKTIQEPSDGVGARFHRIYAVDLPVKYADALLTMQNVMACPNEFSPQLIARFEKTKGEPTKLQKDDEFMVHITGPWQGPVRVSHVSEASFTFLTLEGHIEAGQIQFRLRQLNDQLTSFEIESVTRSSDGVVDFFYDKLRLAQVAQTEMWVLFCRSVAKHAMSSFSDNGLPAVKIKTERQNPKTGSWEDVSDQFGATAF